MRDFLNELHEKEKSGNISNEKKDLLTSLFKSIKLLHTNPRHPSLKTHEIKDLSKKYKIKVWQSYLDQGKLARRIYWAYRSEEHTSELQSRGHLVCRLLLEKKKTQSM